MQAPFVIYCIYNQKHEEGSEKVEQVGGLVPQAIKGD